MDFDDLFKLLVRDTRYERLLKEDLQIKGSFIGTCYQDPNYDLDIAEVVAIKLITCSTLKRKEPEKNLANNSRNVTFIFSKTFSFNIMKTREIFNYLLDAKFIQLSEGKRIPMTEEYKRGELCNYVNDMVRSQILLPTACVSLGTSSR